MDRLDVGRRRTALDRRVELDLGGRQRDTDDRSPIGPVHGLPPDGLDAGTADVDAGHADRAGGRAGVVLAGQLERLVADRIPEAVDEAAVDLPPVAALGHRERRRDGYDGTVEEQRVAEPADVQRVQLGPLVVGRPLDTRPDGGQQRTVCGARAEHVERVDEGDGERAPGDVAHTMLLGQLVGPAGGEGDMRRSRRRPLLQRAGEELAGRAGRGELDDDVTVGDGDGRRPAAASSRARANGSRVPPPEWQQSRIVTT